MNGVQCAVGSTYEKEQHINNKKKEFAPIKSELFCLLAKHALIAAVRANHLYEAKRKTKKKNKI